MDKCSTDAEFDSYWDYEAKNKNRNRIRVGRQYQATIPPLLKPGQKDGRKSEELETLKWKPDQLSDQALEEYLSMAKGISLFSKSLDSPKPSEKSDNSLQSAIKGLSEFVTSHHPCHHDDGCKVAQPSSSGESSSKSTATSDWSPSEAQLFAQALETCGKNFGAIKKEYLPWKPIKSIIEFYYEGKNEKQEGSSEAEMSGKISPKKEELDSPTCSKEEKAYIKEEVLPVAVPESSSAPEDPPKDAINFLENTRVTDPCRATSAELKMSVNENDSVTASSTVASLKFFLGGRLVLKLNAQQDSGSGTKCQWVQSNDLPKHSNNIKKDRQKKKCIQDESFVINPDVHKLKKKTEDPSSTPSELSDCDPSAIKKAKLKSEYDFPLCSSSWTPPVADGQESIEVDDASSKTSEGYISPVLSSSRFSKADAKLDSISNFNSVGDPKCDSDICWVKSEVKGCNISSEHCTVNDSASKNICMLGGKNSPNHVNDVSPYKQEVLNHKSALSHNKACVKNLCYQPHASHSNRSLSKQWSKRSNVTYPVRTSPCSLSPVSVVDLKSPSKETPLDLSSKLDGVPNDTDHHNSQNTHKAKMQVDNAEKVMPSESESRPASSEFSPQSSNHESLAQSIDSPYKDTINSHKCSEDTVSDHQQCEKCLRQEDSDFSSGKDSENSCQLPYTYCNLPYQCALPKCTKDCLLEEHLCNKSDAEKSQAGSPGYIINDVDENICKKNPAWCSRSGASYYPYYSQCYPYYLSYGVAPSHVSESTVAEVPLDLSSSSEKIKENSDADNLSENVNVVGSDDTDAVERGMLYQLLKNKTSK
ncbi:metastasis-associated protein MTA1 [Nephila pilipes]|uniref:Metastasis-associated protein MTA1 n=1 Tax=Nephila pilipes TaxID=299642 RepID=A0A8X6N7Z9_NEPPI|nr:metastasis-associated protein MTA1 [Nephila pilipes]